MMRMISGRLREMIDIRNRARVVQPSRASDRVGIGRVVTVRDDEDMVILFEVGSFMMFDGDRRVSYAAPLAKLLMGAEVGEVREGKIAGAERAFEVLRIE